MGKRVGMVGGKIKVFEYKAGKMQELGVLKTLVYNQASERGGLVEWSKILPKYLSQMADTTPSPSLLKKDWVKIWIF